MYLYIVVPRPFKHGDIFIWSFSLFLPQPLGMFCGLSEEHQNLRPWPSSQGIFFGSETSMLFCVGCVPFFLSSHVICFGVYVSYINIQYIVNHIWYKYIYIYMYTVYLIYLRSIPRQLDSREILNYTMEKTSMASCKSKCFKNVTCSMTQPYY